MNIPVTRHSARKHSQFVLNSPEETLLAIVLVTIWSSGDPILNINKL